MRESRDGAVEFPSSGPESQIPTPESRPCSCAAISGACRSRGAHSTRCIAPYGVLQSLLADRDLSSTLEAVARVLRPGGTFGLDLVPDVPNWREYSNRVQLKGPAARGRHLTLVESVRQDRVRRLTTFEQRYIERRNGRSREHAFELAFRTLSVRQMTRRLNRAGFRRRSRAGRLPWPPVGRSGGRLDPPRKKEVEFFVPIPRSSACPAIPSGPQSSTRRARSTPSAARFSRASSRN